MTRLISAFTCLFLVVPCVARTITVDDDDPAVDFDNIQAAIDDANDGDVIVVNPGIYTGPGNRDIDFNGLAITVRSTNPNDPNIVATTIIDCNGSIAEPHRGLCFQNGEDANSVVQGFTITNGYGSVEPNSIWSLGGGIYCIGSGPTITNCIITSNSAVQGAGIFAWQNSNLKIIDCGISENSGSGGVYCWESSSPTITDCLISGNGGRGVFCRDAPTANITQCTITGNGMSGISCTGGSFLTISNCVVSDNGQSGIDCFIPAAGTISNCLISGNTENFNGGGIRALTYDEGILAITNCTITDNHAASGGGLSCELGETVLSNCILWANTASQGEDIYLWRYPPPPGHDWPGPPKLTISYSCPGTILVDADYSEPNLVLGPGNIDVDPCFADPCNGDYHLQSAAGRWDPNANQWVIDANTSRCIDAGNPGCPPGDEPIPNGNRINMGAYGGTAEASKSPANWALLADLTNDHRMDFNDLNVFVSYWLECGENIPSDLDRSQSVDSRDFGIFAQEWAQSYLPEAGMNYEIGDCDQGESASLIAGESGQTRFSVTVDGRYIHFEDTMLANCCPDKLELQMTVEGNLITIYEIEHLTMPCLCICEYPVTATLGPFEPGTYTLEVYQDEYYGGFIGSTTFTIE